MSRAALYELNVRQFARPRFRASSAFWRQKKQRHTKRPHDELSLPFLLHRLLRLLLNLHFTCPLWAPDARLLFPSTDAISAAVGAQRRIITWALTARLSLGFCLVSYRLPLLWCRTVLGDVADKCRLSPFYTSRTRTASVRLAGERIPSALHT